MTSRGPGPVPDALVHRYRLLTSETRYNGWRASLGPEADLPEPDPYLCDHGVVGGFYTHPLTERPRCPLCRARPSAAWQPVHLTSPLPGEGRYRVQPA